MGTRYDQYVLSQSEEFKGVVEASVNSIAQEVYEDPERSEKDKALALFFLQGHAAAQDVLLKQFVLAVSRDEEIVKESKKGVDTIPDTLLDTLILDAWPKLSIAV